MTSQSGSACYIVQISSLLLLLLLLFSFFPQGVWCFYKHAVVLEFGLKGFHCRVLVELMNAESETVE